MQKLGDELVAAYEELGEFAVLIDGEPVRLLSLPPGALGKIQADHGVSWSDMLYQPLNRLDVAEAIVSACAVKAGKPDPTPFDETVDLMKAFVKLGSDLPDMPEGETEENPTPAS